MLTSTRSSFHFGNTSAALADSAALKMPRRLRRTCSLDLTMLIHPADLSGHDDYRRWRNAFRNHQFTGERVLFDYQPFLNGFDVFQRAAR